ncbi:receptor-mediated endocytosis protein 6 homolog isoform X1 [Maniola jurtina]|uniref:receptor-mediated endocytosis protein 6 homolog isoform X1 n=1 Tax=Maniola jurtina TaxID=191418 RepID=UPI001E68941D|nr:receptor-mediated endocytosis protein 6 homolog isoform X1 [Maniola jurtina]
MMQPSSDGCMNIAELANLLRREKIFINSERQLLQNLNEEVEKSVLELLQTAWICSQQRQNLTNLITSRCEAESVAACQRASLLENTTFIDAHKVLKYKEVQALGDLLGWLRDTPHLMALCLMLGEDHMPPSLPSSLVAGLYGSCRSPADRTRLLTVIRSLIKHQMATSSDPRKLIRTNKSALPSLYAVFRDGHTPARQFLIAALQAPVMAVLNEDEFFLDIDPDKAIERFSPGDLLKKFGQPNSNEYTSKMARYRKWTVQSLYNLTSRFTASLKEHWANFPATIAWIVQQIVHLLKQHSRTTDREIHAICTDLVLNHFICPAIVNPEAHGVVEVPVSYIARCNLIQVAQIIQMLCLARYQEVEPKVRDLYMKFERSCVWSLVESIAGDAFAPPPPAPPSDAPLRTDAVTLSTVALFTAHDAHLLITFLRRISSKLNNNTQNGSEENVNGPVQNSDESVFSHERNVLSETEGGGATRLAALVANNEPNYRARLHDLLRKMPDFAALRSSPTDIKETMSENGHSKRSILGKVSRSRMPRSTSSDERGAERDLEPEVLVIKLVNVVEQDYVGLVPESKVLECYYGGGEGEVETEGEGVNLPPTGVTAPIQKRTRFSVSHDEVSLGNTSDNLEAVSEAASNHSVTSSLELETEDQNDNLSDMVSANVSGRGSPNISGRETPSSQVTDGDTAGDIPTRRIQANAPVSQAASAAQAKMLKQTRNDIEDKFGKFEIKKLLEGDETISIMSDTWSTDVLASDSETIGDSCEHTQVAASQGSNANTIAPDASETASESAWSMDVLASDSDRNTEVDTDDCVSVAARSDTSWPRRASHHDELAPVTANSTTKLHQIANGTAKRPDVSSPRHTTRPHLPNRSGGYLSATAALCRGGELDLPTHTTHTSPHNFPIENRKSILVNGYPVMTCYASAPESPSTAPPMSNDVFDYVPQDNFNAQSNSVPTESTLEDAAGGEEPSALSCASGSDATSQWVDDSFPTKYHLPSTSKAYDDNDLMDRSLNSSESSFNALSVSQYERRFDSGIESERPDPEPRSAISDLMTRMSSATISSNLVNNIASRIVKSEIRTSIVNISSSRIEKKREARNESNISLSTLSVNSVETSVSDKSSSQDVNSENVTERRISPPPKTVSTGAIPKSISFDATAEKSQRRRIMGEDGLVNNLDELKNNVKRSGGNLLHKFKMFRHKGRSHHHGEMKVSEEEVGSEEVAPEIREGESSEEILAKYRRAAECAPRRQSRHHDLPDGHDMERCEGVVDLNDPEVFNSMKRRLRVVLANTDFHSVQYVPNRCTSTNLTEWVRAGGSAEAAAAARALSACGARAARLAAALRADLAARRPYAAYLASCRAALAHSLHDLQTQIKLVRWEWSGCARAAAAARVLEQLERGPALRRLAAHHAHAHALLNGGELMDERATRLTASIKAITAEVKADPSWEGATATIIESAEVTVERAVFARLYLHVLFPNGDGDIARDQVLSDHIRRLSASTNAIRAGVPPRHLWAAPFPHAQLQLRYLPVYRTPKDKVTCVLRCVRSLVSTLALTDGSPPAADDLTPALVLVIIKVNPPSLLSTIELVNALGGSALSGEALYWWTQFCASVAYIKTMDYPAPAPAPHPPSSNDS